MVDTGAIVIPIVIIASYHPLTPSPTPSPLFLIASVARFARHPPFPLQFGLGPDFNRHLPLPSTVASTLYRASPIDPALKSGSPQEREFPYDLSENSSARHPSNGSIPFSTTLPDIKSVTKFGPGESDGYPGSSVSTSLPGLAALASVASAPTSNLRCVDIPYKSQKETIRRPLGDLSCLRNLQSPWRTQLRQEDKGVDL
ncbi:unnamed protein product [Penicillium glandicola]